VLTSWDKPKHQEMGVLSAGVVDNKTDEGKEEDNYNGPQGRSEEEHFALRGPTFGGAFAGKFDAIQRCQGGHTHRGIQMSFVQVLMNTRYAGSVDFTPRIPRSDGVWPSAIVIAEPVMNAETAGNAMKSTSHPKRRRPITVTIAPEIMASEEATM